MLTPRLTTCKDCPSILSLIEEIDCKLAKLAGNLYNNITMMLNQPVNATLFVDLITYKRILQYKYVNSSYAGSYTINMIRDKVKLLKFK